MNADYDAWNTALCKRFLQGRSDEPLYLYTDDAVLEEVSADVGVDPTDAVTHFVRSVRSTLLTYREPFRGWVTESRKPVPDEGPSYLAVLCFLVWVAVESETTHFQYYPGLNRALGWSESAGPPPAFDHHVPLLFSRLNEWLELAGRCHGRTTAMAHPHFPNVGWPLSQAMVRPADRALIVRLFVAARLKAKQPLTAGDLRARVLPRLRAAGETPARRRLLALEHDHPDVLEAVLAREYAAWNGEEALRVGPSRVNVRLCFDETYGDWWFLGPVVEGTAGNAWNVGSAFGTVPRNKGLEATPPELWQLVGSGHVGEMQAGPALHSPSRPVRWFSVDPRAGGWAEVPVRAVGEEQLALHRNEREVTALAELEECGGAPSGWRLVRVPTGAASDVPTDEPTRAKAVLEGGLVLDAASRSYLLGGCGLPRLVNVTGAAEVDGRALAVVDGKAALAQLGLGAGSYRVRCEGDEFPIRVLEALQSGPVFEDQRGGGWWTEIEDSRRVRVPGAQDTVWLLGTDGEVEQRPVRPSTWLDALDLMDDEVDVTGLVRSTPFLTRYVVAPSYMGRPWVEKVPHELAAADPAESRREVKTALARSLVGDLLVDYGPDERKDDKEWKRCLAAMMRQVHR